MSKAKQLIMLFSFAFVIVVAGWITFNIQQSQNKNVPPPHYVSEEQMKVICENLRDAMLNPNLPASKYDNTLDMYNRKCAIVTGPLLPILGR